jgi:hypothetical protein
MRSRITSLTLAVAAVALVACGPSGEKTVATGNGGTVTQKTGLDGSQTLVAKDAQGNAVTMGTGAAASAKTPAYAPVYPGATIETSINASGPNEGGMVMFKTNAPAATVIDFYKKSTASAGMASALDMTTGDTMSYSAKDEKTNHAVTVVATKDGAQTNVQVTWSNHG